ncbi:MAG: hypothetical protein IKZ58_08280 [Selenomonadaceae bacterium]|nr:hypothetical protein [Selenomonadaceae bacterium]
MDTIQTTPMSAKYKGCMAWIKNKEWYAIDENRNRYCLTEKASEEARKSFEMYKRLNWRVYKDVIIDYERI